MVSVIIILSIIACFYIHKHSKATKYQTENKV